MNFAKIKHNAFVMGIGIFLMIFSEIFTLARLDAKFSWADYFSLLSIGGLIVLLIGVGSIRKEHRYFLMSFVFLLVSVGFALLSFFFYAAAYKGNSNMAVVGNVLMVLSEILTLLGICFISEGFRFAFKEQNNLQMAKFSEIALTVYVVATILYDVLSFIKVSGTLATIFTIMAIAIMVVGDAFFGFYLIKANKTLKE